MIHNYSIQTKWTGNLGNGTKHYKAYSRNYELFMENKPTILCSSDPAFMGEKERHNPEELFLASLSSCHMLWYLHLCSVQNVLVVSYVDYAKGIMQEKINGSGQFTSVTLNPVVTITDKEQIALAHELHQKANEMCFIANSCCFTINHQADIRIQTNNY